MFTLSSFNFIFNQFRFVSRYLSAWSSEASKGASGGKSASTCRIVYIRGFTTFRPTLTCSFMTGCKTKFTAGERWEKTTSAMHPLTTLHTWLYTADSRPGLLACRFCLERTVVLFCFIFITWRITCCFFPIVWHSMVRSWQYRTVGQTGQGRLIVICLKLCRTKVKTQKNGSHLILRGDKGYHILLELEII